MLHTVSAVAELKRVSLQTVNRESRGKSHFYSYVAIYSHIANKKTLNICKVLHTDPYIQTFTWVFLHCSIVSKRSRYFFHHCSWVCIDQQMELKEICIHAHHGYINCDRCVCSMRLHVLGTCLQKSISIWEFNGLISSWRRCTKSDLVDYKNVAHVFI